MSEKLLNVKVAEALGCRVSTVNGCPGWQGEHFHCECYSHPHVGRNGCSLALAEYDTDWSATGPLIERYRIEIERNSRTGSWACSQDEKDDSGDIGPIGQGPTPLIAVCRLLLSLKAAGKLPMSEDKP